MLLHGVPMIIHVAKRSLRANKLDEVVVCTDSIKIVQACFNYKIKVCLTPSSCQNGTERILVAKQRLGILDTDLIIDIQGDEPLVDPESIDRVASYAEQHVNEADIILPHMVPCPTNNRNVVKVVASGNKVIYLTRSDTPFNFNKDISLKKHLSIIGFTGGSLEAFGRLSEGGLETVEGVELLRALEGGLQIQTFPIVAESFSVDVMEDFERAERALRSCPIFAGGYL